VRVASVATQHLMTDENQNPRISREKWRGIYFDVVFIGYGALNVACDGEIGRLYPVVSRERDGGCSRGEQGRQERVFDAVKIGNGLKAENEELRLRPSIVYFHVTLPPRSPISRGLYRENTSESTKESILRERKTARHLRDRRIRD